MKKSDLTRRAKNYAFHKRWERFSEQEKLAGQYGWENGYRAARADLRRVIAVKRPFRVGEYWTLSRIRQCLRPIR